MPDVYFGVDVSKDFLDLCDGATGRTWRITNTAAAVAGFADGLTDDVHVVFEATGSYDRAFRRGLNGGGIAYSRINPRRARSFADAAGYLAKTDKVDATMLAEYGRRFRPRPDVEVDPDRKSVV